MNWKPILHIYGNSYEAMKAMNDFASDNQCDPNLNVRIHEGIVMTSYMLVKFYTYRSYELARQTVIGCQFGAIYFHTELPKEVIDHFNSRIRWFQY